MKIFPAGIQKTAMPVNMRRIEDVSVRMDSDPSTISFCVSIDDSFSDNGPANIFVIIAPTEAVNLVKEKNIQIEEFHHGGGDPTGDKTFDILYDGYQPNKRESNIILKIRKICNEILYGLQDKLMAGYHGFEKPHGNVLKCWAFPKNRTGEEENTKYLPTEQERKELYFVGKEIEKGLSSKGYLLNRSLKNMAGKWEPSYLPQ